MKKQFLALAMGAAALFTGCQENSLELESNSTKFSVRVEESVASRAAATNVNNYVMAIYDNADAIVVEPTKSTNGEFAVELMDGQDYTALFWADVNNGSDYNTADLKAVVLSGANASEAWAGKAEFNTGEVDNVNVTLNRAVAKLTLKENGNIPAGSTLKVSMNQFSTFNAADMTVGTQTVAYAYETTFAAAVEGTAAAEAVIATDLYVLASASGSMIENVNFDMYKGTELFSQIDASNVPVKANSNTNISGHYISSSNFTLNVDCDDVWDSEEGSAELGENEGTTTTPEPSTPADNEYVFDYSTVGSSWINGEERALGDVVWYFDGVNSSSFGNIGLSYYNGEGGSMYNKSAFGEGVAEIVIELTKGSDFTVYVGTSENPTSEEITPAVSGSVYTYTVSGSNPYFTIKNNSTSYVNFNAITVKYNGTIESGSVTPNPSLDAVVKCDNEAIMTAMGATEIPTDGNGLPVIDAEFTDFTVTSDKGAAATPFRLWTDNSIRSYAGNTVTLTAKNGKSIVGVEFSGVDITSATEGTVDGKAWSGSVSSVTLTLPKGESDYFNVTVK